MDSALFDREFLRKLESLAFVSRRIYRGGERGAHASVRRGTSLDFADFRAYQPGDDFRTIDWGIFGRMDRLFVRLYAEEEDLTVHLLLDASGSMAFGAPPKFDYARRLAAALGYVGIGSLDRVGVTTFSAGLGEAPRGARSAPGGARSAPGGARSASGGARSASGGARSASGGARSASGGAHSAPASALAPRRGRSQLFHLLEYMSALTPEGHTDIARSLEEYARRSRTPGLAIVISDLLDDSIEGYRRGLQALLFYDFDVVLVHVLDREEIDPGEQGALRMTDMETGQSLPLSVDRPLLAAYRARVTGFFGEVEAFCLKNRIEYLRTATVVPFEDVVLRYLRQGAHLHAR